MQQYAGRPYKGKARGIRPVALTDIRCCVSLINSTHRGYDLFRPRTEQELELRLDGGYWGARPTDRLGRDFLVTPLEQFPRVAAMLERFEPVLETRAMGWLLWDENGGDVVPPDPQIARPFTDLMYW